MQRRSRWASRLHSPLPSTRVSLCVAGQLYTNNSTYTVPGLTTVPARATTNDIVTFHYDGPSGTC